MRKTVFIMMIVALGLISITANAQDSRVVGDVETILINPPGLKKSVVGIIFEFGSKNGQELEILIPGTTNITVVESQDILPQSGTGTGNSSSPQTQVYLPSDNNAKCIEYARTNYSAEALAAELIRLAEERADAYNAMENARRSGDKNLESSSRLEYYTLSSTFSCYQNALRIGNGQCAADNMDCINQYVTGRANEIIGLQDMQENPTPPPEEDIPPEDDIDIPPAG